MRVNIVTKNLNVSDNLKAVIEKKIEKLGKYFSDDITANVMLTQEGGLKKIEVTINAKGIIFRAEELTSEAYEGIDKVVDKLSSQMSRFKKRLVKKHKGNKAFKFDAVPDVEEEELKIVKTKKFDLSPMTVDEAIIQMELLQHTFFIFMNMETDTVNVVYKRKNSNYGLLETSY
ncbi:MAG: ribosome-associated translation inhibitor RaiA [Eubacteriales bacterium]|nr:ribosome-associated translation inhibitor RaiA [Eubacteriales bacterium]MDD4389585.1 ribosome-associated translation inhibitor RaiA [Eubacteriales bacterium]